MTFPSEIMTTDKPVEPTLTAARCHDLAWRAEEQAQMEERRLRTPQTILRATAAALRAYAAILDAVEAAPESPEALKQLLAEDRDGRDGSPFSLAETFAASAIAKATGGENG